jgi:Mn2+/Fe2+ NRAMP family transporter
MRATMPAGSQHIQAPVLQYGYTLLWTFIPMTISLIVVQEMCMRMGVVTGQGLADLIRENFGVRWTAFVMLALLTANTGVVISEFVGIGQASELFGVSKYFTDPGRRTYHLVACRERFPENGSRLFSF